MINSIKVLSLGIYSIICSVSSTIDLTLLFRHRSEYWRAMYVRVDKDLLHKFTKSYQHSEEEASDLKKAYVQAKGDMGGIIDSMMCATVEDEDR
jgi:hypothetical protein